MSCITDFLNMLEVKNVMTDFWFWVNYSFKSAEEEESDSYTIQCLRRENLGLVYWLVRLCGFIPPQYGIDSSRMLGHGITSHCTKFCFSPPECKVEEVKDTMATSCDLETETSSQLVCAVVCHSCVDHKQANGSILVIVDLFSVKQCN